MPTDPTGSREDTATRETAPGEAPRGLTGFVRHYLGDIIFGANDGIITTFAVVAGVTGANLSTSVILILGIAKLLADAFSMGASNYLSRRSDEAVRVATGVGTEEHYPQRHAAATFGAFMIAGSMPLIAYLLPVPADFRFTLASIMTLVTLFAVGAGRSAVTTQSWWRSGLEMLGIGAVAALVAYGTGAFVAALTGGVAGV